MTNNELTEVFNNGIDERQIPPRISYPKRTIAVSVIIHVGIIVVIALAAQPSQKTMVTQAESLNSYLVVRKPKVINKPAFVDQTVPEDAQALVEPDVEAMVDSSTQTPVNEALPAQQLTEQLTKEAPFDAGEIDWKTSTNPLIQRQDMTKTQKTRPSVTGLSADTIKQLNQSAYNNMMVEETKQYNRLKNSPVIDTIGTKDTTIVLKDYTAPVITCEGAVSETLVLLSTLTGGRTQCKRYEIQSFIDKRLNNNAEQRKN